MSSCRPRKRVRVEEERAATKRRGRKSGITLDVLPFDIHAYMIEGFLAARDMVALGMTCSALCRLTVQNQNMWAALLQRDFGHIYGSCAIVLDGIELVKSPSWSQSWPVYVDDFLDNPLLSRAMRDTVHFVGDAIRQSARAASVSGRANVLALPPFQLGLRWGRTWKWFYQAHAVVDPRDGYVGPSMRVETPTSIAYGNRIGGVPHDYGACVEFDQRLPQGFTRAAFGHYDRSCQPRVSKWTMGSWNASEFAGNHICIDSRLWALHVAIDNNEPSGADGTARSTMAAVTTTMETTAGTEVARGIAGEERPLVTKDDDATISMHNVFVLSHDIGLSINKVAGRLRAYTRFRGSAPRTACWSIWKERDDDIHCFWDRPCCSESDRHTVTLYRARAGMMHVDLYADKQCYASARQVSDGACFHTYKYGRRNGISVSVFANGDVVRVIYQEDQAAKIIGYTVSSSCPHPVFAGRHFASDRWCIVTVTHAGITYHVPCPVGNTPDVRLFWQYVRTGLVGWDISYRERILDMIDREGTFCPFVAKPNQLPEGSRHSITNVEGSLSSYHDFGRWPLFFG